MLSLFVVAVLTSPNVVLISVDTLRADHLGCYGYGHPTSPNIDALAAESLVFEDVVCEVPLTGPSFGSMMTSRFPRVTGMTRNGIRMPQGIPTVAEEFQAAGYHTFSVQSNWTIKDRVSGLGRGFAVYEDAFHKKRWGFIKSERKGDEVTEIALRLLSEWDQTKPLFCWIHYSDPHAPYEKHGAFTPTTKEDFASRKGRKVGPKYDSEIAYTDDQIGQLLEALPKENTYLVFVGDHGESLYEHDYLGHGRRVYQTGLHIPFIVNGPTIKPGRSTAPARGIDVGTTLLGLVGIDAPETMMGTNLVGGTIETKRARVIETYGGAVPNLPGAMRAMADKPPQLQSVLFDGWKLILEKDNAELFHLKEDALEERNLAGDYPERVAALAALIREWDNATARMASEVAELNEDDEEALKSLGYID